MSSMTIELREPGKSDLPEIDVLLCRAIRWAFEHNAINFEDAFQSEVAEKSHRITHHINSPSDASYFLLARCGEAAAGIAGIFPLTESIIENTPGASSIDLEIGCVYIHPDYHRQNIATQLVDALMAELQSRCISHFYLDCGYPSSQTYWKRKFGEPLVHLENFFESTGAYMIWKVEVE